jgi:NADPH2:quinone reductase
MRTVQITAFGGPDVLQVQTVPDPEPAAGQVLVRVRYIEVLFIDTQLRSGWGREFFDVTPPWVPGTGVAGTITAVGPGVPTSRLGSPVIARTGDQGAYAELAVVDADEAYDVPHGLDLATATAALHDGVLALDRLERAEVGPASRVLITAAAGSLGHWFIPLSKRAGAYVVGAAGGTRKTAAVIRLGADLALDYRRTDWINRATGGFTVVFDGAGGAVGRAALSLTADGGQFFAYGAASGDFGARHGDRGITVVPVQIELDADQWRRHTRRALQLLADGHVRPVIGQQQPLSDAARAHQAIADRQVIGKTLLVAHPNT